MSSSIIRQGRRQAVSGKTIAVSLSMLLSLTLLASCSRKEERKIADEAAAEGNQALTDEQLMQDLPPVGTPGGPRRATIESDYPCNLKTECTFTKFSNTPKNANECGCQAACTPFVVNKSEKDRREASNRKHCTNKDWFGDQCPTPSCGFIEFDDFECIDGKCVGHALGQ